MKTIKTFFLVLVSIFASHTLLAQSPRVSSESHRGAVTAILPVAESKDSTFFTSGKDGTVIRWSSDGMGEHYQIGDLEISSIAKNPKNNDIAVLETDGASLYRVLVMDWKNLSRKYTKQFAEPVLSLTYSAQGSYLFISTAGMNGFFILNAETGKLITQALDVPNGVTMIQTGATEKTAMLYSKTGTLCYYNLATMQKIDAAQFSTEEDLENAMIAGSGKFTNRFLLGTKNGLFMAFDTRSGKSIASCRIQGSALMLSEDSAGGAYIIALSGKEANLYRITAEQLAENLNSGNKKLASPTAIVRYTGFSAKEKPAFASIGKAEAYFGTSAGTVYKATLSSATLTALTRAMYSEITDIASDGQIFYMLTAEALYASSYDKKTAEIALKNNGFTNFLLNGSNVIFWSKGTRKAVQMVPLSGGAAKTLFVPEKNIQALHISGTKIISVQGSTSVYLYNTSTGKNTSVYSGVSIEDAVLTDENTLYVGKASAGANDSCLVMVNPQTQETVSLPITGFASYTLSYEKGKSTDIYGIAMCEQGEKTSTEVYAYSPASRVSRTIFKFNQEDSRAFVDLHYPVIFSNVGKNQIYSYNIKTGTTKIYRRTNSIPVKMAYSEERIAFLNSDGSISWYNPASQTALGEWYLTVEGEWFEL